MKKTPIEKQSALLSHVRFDLRMKYLSIRSIELFKEKYAEKKDLIKSNNGFILDSLLELFIRSKEGIVIPYSDRELNKMFNESISLLYNSQNKIIKHGTNIELFGLLFSLWEFEEQEDMFIKLFRYSFFFNFKNEIIDMSDLFLKKFGCQYDDFIKITILIVLVAIGGTYASFYNYVSQIANDWKTAFNNLQITSDEFFENSLSLCPDINDVAFSVKVSHSFPFIKHKDKIYLPLPHAIVTACTKSLLYRLTYKNDDLRRNVGKEVMENYVYSISDSSDVYDLVSREVFFNEKKRILSPDVLCFKGDELMAFECKLLTPAPGVRLLDSKSVDKLKEILIDDVCKLYKSLFLNYSTKDNNLPFVEKDNRFGTVLLLERTDFDHRSIMQAVADKLNLSKEEKAFMAKHIRYDVLYSFERLTFCSGNAIEEMKYMMNNNKEYDFDISHKSSSKNYNHKEFLKFKKRVLDFKVKV